MNPIGGRIGRRAIAGLVVSALIAQLAPAPAAAQQDRRAVIAGLLSDLRSRCQGQYQDALHGAALMSEIMVKNNFRTRPLTDAEAAQQVENRLAGLFTDAADEIRRYRSDTEGLATMNGGPAFTAEPTYHLCMIDARLAQIAGGAAAPHKFEESKPIGGGGGRAPAPLPQVEPSSPPPYTGPALTREAIDACDKQVMALERQKDSWPGTPAEVRIRYAETIKTLFNGICAGHPQAAQFLKAADDILDSVKDAENDRTGSEMTEAPPAPKSFENGDIKGPQGLMVPTSRADGRAASQSGTPCEKVTPLPSTNNGPTEDTRHYNFNLYNGCSASIRVVAEGAFGVDDDTPLGVGESDTDFCLAEAPRTASCPGGKIRFHSMLDR